MNLVPRAILHVFREDFGLWAYKGYTRRLFDARLRGLQLQKLKKLLLIYSENLFKKFLFADEKNFIIE